MRTMQTLSGFVALAALAGFATQANAQIDEPGSCEALAATVIAADSVRLPTGGITLTSAVYVPAAARTTAANGEAILELPVHCRVQGAIASVDVEAPSILFNVNLPVDWNGKALQSGGGGANTQAMLDWTDEEWDEIRPKKK